MSSSTDPAQPPPPQQTPRSPPRRRGRPPGRPSRSSPSRKRPKRNPTFELIIFPPFETMAIDLARHAQFSFLAFQTSYQEHVPFLQASSSGPRRQGGTEGGGGGGGGSTALDVVFLGDTLVQEMQSVGGMRNLHAWPPVTTLTHHHHHHTRHIHNINDDDRIHNVFNAGAREERLEHLIYRLVGDPDRRLIGLAQLFKEINVRLYVVHVGTNHLADFHDDDNDDADDDNDNNVNDNHTCEDDAPSGLTEDFKFKLYKVLRFLLSCSTGQPVVVLLTGLFYRWDVSHAQVDLANRQLSVLADNLALTMGQQKVLFLPPSDHVKADIHMPDGVHLTADGYAAWTTCLFPAVQHALGHQRALERLQDAATETSRQRALEICERRQLMRQHELRQQAHAASTRCHLAGVRPESVQMRTLQDASRERTQDYVGQEWRQPGTTAQNNNSNFNTLHNDDYDDDDNE